MQLPRHGDAAQTWRSAVISEWQCSISCACRSTVDCSSMQVADSISTLSARTCVSGPHGQAAGRWNSQRSEKALELSTVGKGVGTLDSREKALELSTGRKRRWNSQQVGKGVGTLNGRKRRWGSRQSGKGVGSPGRTSSARSSSDLSTVPVSMARIICGGVWIGDRPPRRRGSAACTGTHVCTATSTQTAAGRRGGLMCPRA
jgi:hypothetical protein